MIPRSKHASTTKHVALALTDISGAVRGGPHIVMTCNVLSITTSNQQAALTTQAAMAEDSQPTTPFADANMLPPQLQQLRPREFPALIFYGGKVCDSCICSTQQTPKHIKVSSFWAAFP